MSSDDRKRPPLVDLTAEESDDDDTSYHTPQRKVARSPKMLKTQPEDDDPDPEPDPVQEDEEFDDHLVVVFHEDPLPMPRPRFKCIPSTFRVITWIPDFAVDHIEWMKATMREQFQAVPFPANTSLKMTLYFYIKRPDYHFKKGDRVVQNIKPEYACNMFRVAGIRKDIDNMVKMVMDAGNGVLYHDDCQIVELSSVKLYDNRNDCTGRTVLCLEPVDFNRGYHSHLFE